MSDETPTARLPDIASELAAFNEWRASVLRGQPIRREGMDWYDLGVEAPEVGGKDR